MPSSRSRSYAYRDDDKGRTRSRAQPLEDIHHRSRSYNPGREEIIIRTAVKDEDSVLDPEQGPESQLTPTDPNGYRELLVRECLELIETRRRDFDQMDYIATLLGDQVSSACLVLFLVG